MHLGPRLKWVTVGVVVGLAFGGVAYAGYTVANVPPAPTDRYFACVSTAGLVRASTVKLNVVPPTCPAASDKIRSWNAVGNTGPSGATGATGATGPTPVDVKTYVGTYSVTFTNAGCSDWQVRLRIVAQSGPPPLHDLGPCAQLKYTAGENADITSTTASRVGSIAARMTFYPGDYFSFDGRYESAATSWSENDVVWSIGAGAAIRSDAFGPYQWNCGWGQAEGPMFKAAEPAGTYLGQECDLTGYVSNTSTPLVPLSSVNPPLDSELGLQAVYSLP